MIQTLFLKKEVEIDLQQSLGSILLEKKSDKVFKSSKDKVNKMKNVALRHRKNTEGS